MGEGGRGGGSARPERRSREWSTCVACRNLNRIKHFGADHFGVRLKRGYGTERNGCGTERNGYGGTERNGTDMGLKRGTERNGTDMGLKCGTERNGTRKAGIFKTRNGKSRNL